LKPVVSGCSVHSIHGVFEQTAAKWPEACAVVNGDRSLSYAELDGRANQLAHFLLSTGVERGALIGVHLERSIDTLVAVLGICKAGAAYLALGVEQPPERLAFMLQDANVAVLISRANLSAPLPAGRWRVVDIAAQWSDISQRASSAPSVQVEPDDLAFCIYTSGSTGQPKGVLVPHRGISALVSEQRAMFEVSHDDRVLQFASFGFDAFLFDVLMAFGSGATLVLRSDQLGEPLVDEMRKQKVTIATLPPSLLGRVSLERADSLRCIIAAGEACPPSYVASAPARATFFNAYGPTEATIWASAYRVSRDAPLPQELPIGHAVADSELLILNERMQPVPAGEVGEIYIAGPALARGYLNRPALTAERFVPHPFGAHGSRLYRTGDLGRWSESGELEFRGRVDHQVKLRGYRIELGEIEQVLLQCGGVREAAVVLRGEEPEHKRLVAFISGFDMDAGCIDALHEQLTGRLADYMVPTEWAFLESLPLNPSGKVDRHALEHFAAGRADRELDYVAPSTLIEREVAEVWAEVLQRKRVGRTHGFRRLGGSSIQAVDVGFRLCRALGAGKTVPPPIGDQTLAEYALAVHAVLHIDRSDASDSSGSSGEGALSFAQEQVCFMEAAGDAWRAYRCHARIDLRGSLDVSALQDALNDLVARHEILRTGFVERQGVHTRSVLPAVKVRLPCVDISHLDPEDRALALAQCVAEELDRRFDITTPPLVRWHLVKLAAGEHVLTQSEHHNVHDGQSFRILLRDLSELYSARVESRAPLLPPLEGDYGDYCTEERQWLKSGEYQRHLSAWEARLIDYDPAARLFASRRASPQRRFVGAQERCAIDDRLCNALVALSARLGVSRYALMFAVFGVLCAKLGQQSRFLLGSALANRTSARFQDTVGMFVNMLPVPFDVESGACFSDFALQIAAHIDFALRCSRVPVAEIVRKLQWGADLRGEAPFNVGFSFHDSMPAAPQFSGLEARLQEALPNGSAKFDLSVVGILSNRTASHAMELLFEYDIDVFDRETVQRMLQHYVSLLEGVAQQPQARLRDLPLIDQAEKQQLLFGWNDTAADYRRDICIHQLFEEQAASIPEAIALIYEGERVTYGALNFRTNRVAHHLHASGVQSGTRVAICLDRSVDMVVGLLGILKSGGAYVPLDPQWPPERRLSLLKALDVQTVVTHSAHLRAMEQLAWDAGCVRHVYCLDGDEAYSPEDEVDRVQTEQFWAFVMDRSDDEMSAGGFSSSYTNEPFTGSELKEYIDQVLRLLGDAMRPGSRILEVGCGSGAVAFELLARGIDYVGIDPSPQYQDRNREKARHAGFPGARFETCYAHEARRLEQTFDAIVMPSVTQFFPSHRYLRAVLDDCLAMLSPGGLLVVADVMDPSQREVFAAALRDYKRDHPQAPVKVDRNLEFHVASAFFEAHAAGLSDVTSTIVRRAPEAFTTELVYRYDVVLHKALTTDLEAAAPESTRGVRTYWPCSFLGPGHLNPQLATADSAAYVIFTSGSTGQPKGVIVKHRPVINLISWVNRFVGVTAADRLFFVTSMCFDLSVYDIFGMLAAGGCVDIVPGCKMKDPEELARYLSDRPVTFWDSAPAAFGYLAPFLEANGRSVAQSSLRTVFLSGDWIPLSMPDRIHELFPSVRIVALGGATEAAVWSNYFVVDRVERHWRSIPYGRPIQNARYYILDEHLQPQPIGVPGNLYIGGECLAAGYFGDPTTSASKFIPDPFAAELGRTMYCTGDLAQFMPDGTIEFLGRIDQQVKIRGFRIELGEIESALLRCSGVSEAILMARDEPAREKTLVAYVIRQPGATLDAGELRRQLDRLLPTYMVPSSFIVLDAWPLNANGKVDRKALPVIGTPLALEGTTAHGTTEPPTKSALRDVLSILHDLVPGARFGPEDDLIAAGMHSLAMMRFVSRCQEVFGAHLRVRDIYRLSTPSAIAQAIRESKVDA
jgi:amino acid adenylation domain-containing protein